jgi:hypothetical protein
LALLDIVQWAVGIELALGAVGMSSDHVYAFG